MRATGRRTRLAFADGGLGGGEAGYIAPDPRDPNIVYAADYQGLITRYDRQTKQRAELLNLYAQRAAREGHAFRFDIHDYEAFGAGFGFAIAQSVVRIRPAIDAAFCSAVRVTLVGSMTPAFTRSS